MATLVRDHDWSATSLGPIASWSPALRVFSTTVLDMAMPAIVLWGPDLIQVYNDGYRSFLGLRHPAAVGQPTRDCWPEVWHFNEPIYKRVMESGQQVYLEDQEYIIEPSGTPETHYFTISFAPARDESGKVGGVLVVVTETTRRVLAERESQSLLSDARLEAERLNLMFAHAPGFMALLKGPDHVFEAANPAYLRLLNNREVMGKTVRQAIPEIANQGFVELLDRVYLSGDVFVAEEMPIVLQGNAGTSATRYLDFVYQPTRNENGDVTGIFVEGSDVTQRHDAQLALLRLNEELTDHVARLEEGESRLAFQLRLAERLRPLSKADDVISAACELLGRHLGLSRVLFCEVDDAQGTFFIRHDWTAAGVESVAGKTRALKDFGPVDVETLRCGEAVIHDDILRDIRSAGHADAYAKVGIRATLAIPLVKTSRLTAIFNLHQVEPRHWSHQDIQLAHDVASWTWSAAESARAQAELRTERDQSQHTFDNMLEGFALIDSEWRMMQMNAAGLRHSRRSAEQVVGKIHWEVWPEALGTELETVYRRVMSTGKAESLKQYITSLDGHHSWIQVNLQRLPSGWLAVFFRDVTEETNRSAELRTANKRIETALRVAQLGTYNWDSVTDEAECSPRTREIFGFGESEGFAGEDYFARILPEDLEGVRQKLAASTQASGEIDIEYRIKRRDGKVRHLLCQGASLPDSDGAWRHYAGVFHDVTERKDAETVMRGVDRRKDEFLSMLAHELKNPLAPIVTGAEILKHPGLDRETIQNVGAIILRQATHMTGLLADLLDVSRINEGLVTLDRNPVDLKQALRDAIEQTRPLMDLRHQQFSQHMPAAFVWVEGDHARLVQVFSNLLNNSAKYTLAGGVIAVKLGVSGDQAVISVSDGGIGISAELLPHVFEIFTQAERSSDRHLGGLGLGLSLVKNLVTLLRGTVTAKSAGLGKGSEFTVTLPLLDTVPVAINGASALPVSGVKTMAHVMVVDDNVDAAATLAMLLEMEGHTVFVAHSAEDALRAAKSVVPDVFVLDIGLPGMDGYQLARALRADPATRDTLLIALTGYGQTQDRERSRAAGFNHHFDKPIDPTELLDLLSKAEVV